MAVGWPFADTTVTVSRHGTVLWRGLSIQIDPRRSPEQAFGEGGQPYYSFDGFLQQPLALQEGDLLLDELTGTRYRVARPGAYPDHTELVLTEVRGN